MGYWTRSQPVHSDQPLLSRKTNRTLARAATAACLLIIGVLAASFGGGEVNPFQVLVSGLAVGGMGFNVYFLYRWFRALARGGRKRTILLIGAAWLIASGVVSVITLALGFASCAGGCGGGGPVLADWVFMLSTWGIGVGSSGGWIECIPAGRQRWNRRADCAGCARADDQPQRGAAERPFFNAG